MRNPFPYRGGWWVAAVAACSVGMPGAAPPASGQGNLPLQLQVVLRKQRFMEWEEMPLLLQLANVSPAAAVVRLPRAGSTSVDLQVIDTRTNRLAPRSMERSGPGPGIFLRFHKLHRRVRRGGKPGAGSRQAKRRGGKKQQAPGQGRPLGVHSMQSSARPMSAPLVVLRPGEIAEADYELLRGLYGQIAPGRYLIRALYATEGIALASPAVPFVVTPMSRAEQAAWQDYQHAQNGYSRDGRPGMPVGRLRALKECLRLHPGSVFEQQMRHWVVVEAINAGEWPTGVEEGRKLMLGASYSGMRNWAASYLGVGLWHTGHQAEAEALLKSIEDGGGSYYLNALRNGEK